MEAGWKFCLDALDALKDDDLTRTITIRTEPHSVMQAINRQVGHYAHHVGQIVFLAKHFAGEKMANPKRPQEKVRRLQPPSSNRRSIPALAHTWT